MSEGAAGPRIAYLTSRYPVLTETFILREVLELVRQGVDVELYPLLGLSPAGRAPTDPLAGRLHDHHALSLEALAAQLHWLRRRPRRYLGLWARALRAHARSPVALAKAAAVLPRAALLARRMQRRGVAHVHAHWATHPALAALAVEALTGIGYSFTAHAHDLYLDRSMLAEKIAGARFVVTISRFNRALIRSSCGGAAAARTVVIPCGVDAAAFAPRPEDAPAPGPLRIACVAGLRDYKGLPWLVEACALLRARGVALQCVLVGEGPERRRLAARIAEAGLRGEVLLLGGQPEATIRAVLRWADVVTLPSVVTPEGMMDGIPVALMEALAAARAVVSTRVSGIPELVVDGVTGLLVPPRDARALADALQRLHLDRGLARRLGARGRAHVLERFDLARNAARLRARLAWAAGGAPPAPRASVLRGDRAVARPPAERASAQEEAGPPA